MADKEASDLMKKRHSVDDRKSSAASSKSNQKVNPYLQKLPNVSRHSSVTPSSRDKGKGK